MFDRILELKDYLHRLGVPSPEIAIMPFRGVDFHVGLLEDKREWKVDSIAAFPEFTFFTGRINSISVWLIPDLNLPQPAEDVFLLRVAVAFGAGKFVLLNNSVSLKNASPSLMVVNDQIHLSGLNPLSGKNIDELGPRFPDMSMPFNASMIDQAVKVLQQSNIDFSQGVYAEVKKEDMNDISKQQYFSFIGADRIGESMARQVIAIRHMQKPVLAFSADHYTNEFYTHLKGILASMH